VTNIA